MPPTKDDYSLYFTIESTTLLQYLATTTTTTTTATTTTTTTTTVRGDATAAVLRNLYSGGWTRLKEAINKDGPGCGTLFFAMAHTCPPAGIP